MEKLERKSGSGSIVVTSGKITLVVGFGSVEQIQAKTGTGATLPIKGHGGVNETTR